MSYDFTADQYRKRREKLGQAIGEGRFALLPGSIGPAGEEKFTQSKDFYYLSGIEVPGAYLLIRGGDGRTSLFVPHATQVDPAKDDPIPCYENAELAKKISGVDEVLGVEQLSQRLLRAFQLYVLNEDDTVRGENRYHHTNQAARIASDPWDGRLTRATQLIDHIRRRFPHIEIHNLTPIMDELRSIKDPAELARLRHAGRLTAQGVIEAIRSTAPGVYEYQLDAVMRYHFIAGGGFDRAYSSIIASGSNILYPHYNAIDQRLESGDWVLGDSAADFQYYVSDIGRMWPVDGVYSPEQRSLYGYVVEYHKVMLDCVRPGRSVDEIHNETAERMRDIYNSWEFANSLHKETAELMFTFTGHVSHAVGLNVHEGFSLFGRSNHYSRPLEPGMVLSIDPTIDARDRGIYVRIEDTVAITEDGIENLTVAAPTELDDVEALMQEEGVLQSFPPTMPE